MTEKEMASASITPLLRTILICVHLWFSIGVDWGALTHHSALFHIPFPGLEFLRGDGLFFWFGWLAVISGVLALFNIAIGATATLSGLMSLPFILASVETRYSFTYLPTLAVIGFGLVGRERNSFPLIALLSSLYLTAALHKLTHFTAMLQWLPLHLSNLVAEPWSVLSPWLLQELATCMAWSVVPVELMLGTLYLIPKMRIYAFLLAFTFHSVLNVVFAGDWLLASVGFNILCVHSAIACIESDLRWSTLWSSRSARWTFAAFAGIGIIDEIFVRSGLMHGLLKTIWLYGPICVIGLQGYQSMLKSPAIRARGAQMWALIAFASLLLVWSLTPVLTDYTNQNLGWAMFAGAERSRPVYSFEALAKPCLEDLRLKPLFAIQEVGGKVVFSFQPYGSGQFLRDQIRSICPVAEAGEIHAGGTMW